MSSLLNEAIVDATALKEAALKNAEAAVIDKYSAEVKQTLETLLEQEDELGLEADPAAAGDPLAADPMAAEVDPMAADPMAADMGAEMEPEEEGGEDIAPDVPLAAADGIGKNSPSEETPVEFNVDLQALQEAVASLEGELDEDEEIEITEEALAALMEDEIEEAATDAGSFAGEEAEEGDEDDDDSAAALAGSAAAEEADSDAMKNAGLEESELNEEEIESLVDAIAEKLTVDMGATLSGWAGRSSESMKWELQKALAHRRSTGEKEELDVLRKAQDELVFENNQLTEKLSNYEQAIGQLKENLQDVNLSNARLLYTNRVLRNTSLNERQKTKIVEAISNAGSVAEARTIHDTLQSTVESTPKRGPQSLDEAISRRSSVIRATRQDSTPSDPFSERMKRLAGIK